jgi:hypothetical protein
MGERDAIDSAHEFHEAWLIVIDNTHELHEA